MMNSEVETKTEDVATALTLVLETLGEERDRIFDRGGDAMKAKDKVTAKSVLGFVDDLDVFIEKTKSLTSEWAMLEKKHDLAPEAAKAIIDTGVLFRTRKGKKGVTRVLTHPIAKKKGLIVCVGGCSPIHEKTAAGTFAKAIEVIGVERVYSLRVPCCGELLVDRKPSEKYPTAVIKLKGGYYLSTQSSTGQKRNFLLKIARALGVQVSVDVTE